MSEPSAAELRPVALRALPVPLYRRSQEQTEAMMREFALIAMDTREAPRHQTPRRLLDLVAELEKVYGGLNVEADKRLARAVQEGADAVDVDYAVPPAAAEACRLLMDRLDEADEYCRAGQHLLTLASPPDQVAFREWFLGEFLRQLGGDPPTPWPAYAAAAGVPTPH